MPSFRLLASVYSISNQFSLTFTLTLLQALQQACDEIFGLFDVLFGG
jgi:hypothetical protein